jgi:hypothetical protein
MGRYAELDDAGRERKKDYVRQYRNSVRMNVIIKYGGRCNCCGEDELAFLVIDHVKGGGTADRGSYAYAVYSRLWREPINREETQVLCANCNMAKERQGGCPHQVPG